MTHEALKMKKYWFSEEDLPEKLRARRCSSLASYHSPYILSLEVIKDYR